MKNKLLKLVTPTKQEKEKINKIIKDISKKIESSLKEHKIKAKLVLGGSTAKGTWLPGSSDIDFFLKFDKKYENLSNITEKILPFKAERVKGSRDYFTFKYKNYEIEIVPVYDIRDPKEAKNITDISPLHVNWTKSKKLQDEIRIAKLFLKAQKCYGAESYIKGFSGHVTDILIAYYKSFDNFIKAASKLYSPLIVVDPIQPERNAAAALSKEKFNLLIEVAGKYLKKPSIEFFKEKRITESQLKKRKDKLIILYETPKKKRKDVQGAELLKRFETIKRKLKEYDFKILDSGWQWYPGEKAMYWFYFPKKELSKEKIHYGPPINADKENILEFKKKWKNVKKDKKRYYVVVKRKYRKPEELLNGMGYNC